MSETYNGWTNWATWNAVLWARNDEPSYRWWCRVGRQDGHDLDALAERLARELPENVTNSDMNAGDYLEVNWREVAEACAEDAAP